MLVQSRPQGIEHKAVFLNGIVNHRTGPIDSGNQDEIPRLQIYDERYESAAFLTACWAD
jgi:hypothetical protein